MRRLRGQDAAFWYGETPTWHMHVGSVGIIDPSDAPEFSFDRLRALVVERLPLIPQFRWRAVEAPLHIDRPAWVEDDAFDPDFHIRRVGVPSPGGMHDLRELVGHLMSYKLNRDRPLWELWYIDGLSDGRVAMLVKAHHSIIDGVSGAGLGEILFDFTPEPRSTEGEESGETAGGRASTVEFLARSTFNSLVRTPWRTLRLAAQTAQQSPSLQSSLRRSDRPPMPLRDPPNVAWTGDVTAHRSYGSATIPLDRVKAVKNAAGTKVNDVVLAICSGVLRGYLVDADALPDRPLVVSVPVSLRTDADRGEVGNKVGNMFVSLATDRDDPADRLKAIYTSSQSAKEMREAMSARNIIGITEVTPPALIGLAARAVSSWGLGLTGGGGRNPPINAVISNVPGPPFPLYVAGARLVSLVPLGPLMLGVGLNITAFSYLDGVEFGFQTCPELIPDVDAMAARVPSELQALEDAVGVVTPG